VALAMSARNTLLELFDAALRAVDGRVCVARFLRDANLAAPVSLFAVGKAASSMTRGALDAFGPKVASALVITKDGHVDPALRGDARVAIHESAHPVPDERSLAAGALLERALAEMPPAVLPVFLVSGGSSSLIESLRAGHALEELQALNQRGLASGWDIARLNRERSSLSKLKGGGVAHLLGERAGLALFVSDVPGDDPAVIGSGLLGPGTGADRIERHVVANVDAAVRAAVSAGAAHGLALKAGVRRFDADAVIVAADFLAALRECEGDGLVWGGESTVVLPARHGRGGRNTHLALAAARQLRGAGFTLLAAGTDGTDGPTDDAGAIIDAGTLERAELGGCDVERAFREFDSGTALEAAGDLLHTGPTGTNVGDVLIGLKRDARALRGRGASRVL
jgi:hydroxypyruvate reductase